jgi:phosphohistidine phosphatase
VLVVLLRHGIAHDRADPNCPPDEDRALTEEGIKKTRKVCRALAKLVDAPTRVMTSPLVRARQTAALAAEGFALDPGALVVTDALLPDAPPYALFHALFAFNAEPVVVCAGHAPNLDRVVALALTGSGTPVTRLKKAGVAVLQVDDLPRTHGELLWLAPPRLLSGAG